MNQEGTDTMCLKLVWPFCVTTLTVMLLLVWLVIEAKWTHEGLVRDNALMDRDATFLVRETTLLVREGACLDKETALLEKESAPLKELHRMQADLAAQAVQAEDRLKTLMVDLIALSKTNSAALTIVRKYNIKFNP